MGGTQTFSLSPGYPDTHSAAITVTANGAPDVPRGGIPPDDHGFRRACKPAWPDNREHPERRRPRPERVPGDPGYEIRGRRKAKDGRASIEAWLPGWHWPVVGAVEDAGRWLVLADPKIADLAALAASTWRAVRSSAPRTPCIG